LRNVSINLVNVDEEEEKDETPNDLNDFLMGINYDFTGVELAYCVMNNKSLNEL